MGFGQPLVLRSVGSSEINFLRILKGGHSGLVMTLLINLVVNTLSLNLTIQFPNTILLHFFPTPYSSNSFISAELHLSVFILSSVENGSNIFMWLLFCSTPEFLFYCLYSFLTLCEALFNHSFL